MATKGGDDSDRPISHILVVRALTSVGDLDAPSLFKGILESVSKATSTCELLMHIKVSTYNVRY